MHYVRLNGYNPCTLKQWTNFHRFQDTTNAKLYLRIYYHSKARTILRLMSQNILLVHVFYCNILTKPFG